MSILLIYGFVGLLLLVLAGSLWLQPWNSNLHLLNADGLDTEEKFKLVSRWGAQS